MTNRSNSIVALDRFILSTRDSGYKSTSSAVSELIDNALQAGARNVRITIDATDAKSGSDLQLQIADDGCGMDRPTLVQAMRFGGSGRYNDRGGLGRFGMGLPNASLGQARRVTVYTWQSSASVLGTYLDVDEISSGNVDMVPDPARQKLVDGLDQINPEHGTTVIWDRCDRLDNRRPSTLSRKLATALGRTFRHFLFGGLTIQINGVDVKPVDPLYLNPTAVHSGARPFQSNWICEVYADPLDGESLTGEVEVIFSELPIDAWHDLSNDQKRDWGIANGAGVSIVRGGREVDSGWFFMGAKRRENYDDWWRCEIRFEPVLDEAFGITHTKQQIRPKDYLAEALSSYIETTAKALNARARDRYAAVKSSKASQSAEQVALARDPRMKGLPPVDADSSERADRTAAIKRIPALRQISKQAEGGAASYHLIEDELTSHVFLEPIRMANAVVGVLNPRHQFYRQIYGPLVSGKEINVEKVAEALRLVMIAAARAESGFTNPEQKAVLSAFRDEWSQTMDVLLAKQ